ncbi:hypothetical protein JG688_00017021 [Phytophthora aleatoria]|uniref:Uncharacterized protein n=1 Tax=Phytophthora aleatoria TaxID=2496075 RepID=A0A8J5I7A9_9STRA|nr:hypothetical protein JG688_00017021 [Phytophthora aleatoria]
MVDKPSSASPSAAETGFCREYPPPASRPHYTHAMDARDCKNAIRLQLAPRGPNTCHVLALPRRAKCDWSQPTACTPRTGGAADLCAIRLRSNEGDSRVTCLARGTPPQHEWNGERPDSWNTLKCSPPSLDRIGSRVGPAPPSGSCRPQGLRMASSELGGAASSGGATTARDKLVPRNACVLDARLQADGRSCS